MVKIIVKDSINGEILDRYSTIETLEKLLLDLKEHNKYGYKHVEVDYQKNTLMLYR